MGNHLRPIHPDFGSLSPSLENWESKGVRRGQQKYKTGKKNNRQISGVTHTTVKRCAGIVLATAIPQGLRLFLRAATLQTRKKKQLRTSKGGKGECPTNFQKCTYDCRALVCDIQYPHGLFGNQIWNNLEISTLPSSAARSLLGLASKSKSSRACFFSLILLVWCFLCTVVKLKALSFFGRECDLV